MTTTSQECALKKSRTPPGTNHISGDTNTHQALFPRVKENPSEPLKAGNRKRRRPQESESPLSGALPNSLVTTLKDSALATGIRKTVDSLRWPLKQSEVDKILRVIERQKSTLSLALDNDHIALSREIRNNTEAIRDDVTGLSRELGAAQLDAKNDAESLKHNAILSQLPCADGAPFNAFRRDYERDCLPGTRVELLNEITTWGNTSDGPCIFWLSGMAGTSKSTIARTVARHSPTRDVSEPASSFSEGRAISVMLRSSSRP
ncbi:hypothetical protein V492_00137 [Pseudogymnoascus sp. VKM F-4246]|nr:hypothetical protein V492_00137 [Pseudogymnoascus sp. VKM F-4246]